MGLWLAGRGAIGECQVKEWRLGGSGEVTLGEGETEGWGATTTTNREGVEGEEGGAREESPPVEVVKRPREAQCSRDRWTTPVAPHHCNCTQLKSEK